MKPQLDHADDLIKMENCARSFENGNKEVVRQRANAQQHAM